MSPGAAFRGAVALAALSLLAGCGGDEAPEPELADPEIVQSEVDRGAGIPPESFAGEVTMRIPAEIPLAERQLPFVLYGGLNPVTETRLGVKAFVDLRSVQMRLPELVSGVVDETCNREIALNLIATEAEGDLVRAYGTVRARIYSCNRRDPENEKQGTLWLSQTVDAIATARAEVDGQCIRFRLVDLELDPRGFIGGLANLFGLTELARQVVLEEAETFFADNPVCPSVPPEISSLAPNFESGGVREIGEGGIGAAISGSVDTGAATMIALLKLIQERGIVEGQE